MKFRNKYRLIGFCAVSLMTFIPNNSQAETLLTVNAMPFYGMKNGTAVGMVPAFSEELAKRSGLPITLRTLPIPRMVQMIDANEADFAILSAFTRIDSDKLGTLFEVPVVAIARPGISLKKYEDLQPLNIGLVNGTGFGTKLDSDETLKKSPEPTFEQILRKMGAGRLDVIFGVAPAIYNSARDAELGSVLNDQLILSTIPIAFHAAKGLVPKETQAKIAQTLQDMHKDGTLQTIQSQYVKADWSLK